MSPYSPRPARKGRPFLVLALVFAGLVGFWVLVVAGLFTHPRSRAAIDAMVEFTRAAMAGMGAPGTQALLALGCDGAVVMEFGEAMRLMGGLGVDHPELPPEVAATPWVVCRSSLGSAVPSCEEVSEAYIAEVKPAERFIAAVQRPGEIVCQEYFAPSGDSLGPVGADMRLPETARAGGP